MARVFNGGSNQYLDRSSSFVGGYPLSMFAWVYPTSNSAVFRGISIAAASGISYVQLALRGDLSGDPVEAYVDLGGPTSAASVSGYTTNAWNAIACVHASATSHKVYCNGSSASDTTNVTFPTTSKFSIASGYYSGTQYFDSATSRWCHVALWNAALTDDEIASLAACYHPRSVRRSALVSHWALGGFEGEYDRDPVGGYNLTAYNSPTFAEGPRIIYPVGPLSVDASIAAAASVFRRSLFMRSGSRGVA